MKLFLFTIIKNNTRNLYKLLTGPAPTTKASIPSIILYLYSLR